jgi:hypothetical protein
MIQTGSKRSSQDRPDSTALAGAPAAAGDVRQGPATLPPPLAAHKSCSAQAQAGMAECRMQKQAAAAVAVLLAVAPGGLPAWQPWMVQGRPGATLLRKVVRAGLLWKQRASRSSAQHQSNCCAVLCCGALRCALRATLHHAEGMTFTHGCLLINHQHNSFGSLPCQHPCHTSHPCDHGVQTCKHIHVHEPWMSTHTWLHKLCCPEGARPLRVMY